MLSLYDLSFVRFLAVIVTATDTPVVLVLLIILILVQNYTLEPIDTTNGTNPLWELLVKCIK